MIKALQLCLIIALIGSASAVAATCGALPNFDALKAFGEAAKGDTAEEKVWTDALAAIKAATAGKYQVSGAAADMPYCTTVLKTHDTCCVAATETAIEALLLRHYKIRAKVLPLSLGNLKVAIDDSSKCMGPDVAKEILTLLASSITALETARIASLEAEFSWLRGQACAICADVSDNTKMFVSDKYLVTQAELTAYTTAMKASNTLFETANTALQTLLDTTLQAKAPTCTDLLAAVKKSWTDNKYTVDATKIDCSLSTVFGREANSFYGGCLRFLDYGFDSTKTVATQFTVEAAPAAGLWIPSISSETTKYEALVKTFSTDVQATLPAKVTATTPTTPTEPNDTTPSDDDDSSSTVLYVSALLALFLVLL